VIYRLRIFKKITSLLTLLLPICFFFSCAADHDLLDSKEKVTKLILDKKQLNWDSTYVKFHIDSLHKTLISYLDTLIIIPPTMDVKRVFIDDYDAVSSPKILDDSIPEFWMKRDMLAEEQYKLHWYSFIHSNFWYYEKHYVPIINDNNYKIIERQIKAIEKIFDNNILSEYTMPDSLYHILSKFSGQYYILSSLKERYWQGVVYTPQPRTFVRMRVFIFNKKTKKIIFYNRNYKVKLSTNRYNPVMSYYFKNIDEYSFFAKKVLKPFKKAIKSKFLRPFKYEKN